VAGFGWFIERYVLSFLNNRPLDTILATWGVGIILQQAVRLLVGGELRYVQMPSSLADSTNLLGVPVSAYRIFLFIAAIALFGLTWLLMNRTTIGMKLRAIIQDRSISASFGIDARRIYSLTFAYGAGLAGLAGALVSPLKSVSPEMGTGYVVDSFMVVVLGGVQSLAGTVLSSFILGEVSGVVAFLQNDTVAKALVLLAIIVLIRFRPDGLFTARIRA
jgi:urea transport system permease protein